MAPEVHLRVVHENVEATASQFSNIVLAGHDGIMLRDVELQNEHSQVLQLIKKVRPTGGRHHL